MEIVNKFKHKGIIKKIIQILKIKVNNQITILIKQIMFKNKNITLALVNQAL